MDREGKHRRVLVIGLDGATWDILEPWLDEGLLPNLNKIRQSGVSGTLHSTIHPVTTPAWISFMTGRNQGQHGVYDHVQRREDTYNLKLMDASQIRASLLFDYLGRAGLQSIAINIPQTYPPPPISGLMVSGLFGTIVGPEITNPESLFETIMKAAPGYVVHPDYDPQSADPLGKYANDLNQSIVDRFAVSETLLAENDWQLGVVVFTATDQAQHAFWKLMDDDRPEAEPYRSAIFDVYKTIDDNLPRLLQFVDENTLLFVMSDHGAGPLKSWVNLNRWLADNDLLMFKDSQLGNMRSTLIKKSAAAYKRIFPRRLKARIRRQMQEQFTRAKERMETELFSTAIDWEESRAYAIGACGNIFINLAGREPAGIVEPGSQYEEIRDQIVAKLVELRDPEHDRPLVKEVLRREDVYHGKYLKDAPDLVVIWRDYGYWGRARYDQHRPKLFEPSSTWDFSTLPLTGTHRPEGILMASGPNIQDQATVSGAKLIDLAPTILAFLGVPIPLGFDGRVLENLFDKETLDISFDDDDADERSGSHGFTAEEEAKVKQHLENLGYL